MKNSLHQNYMWVVIILSLLSICAHTDAITTEINDQAIASFTEASYSNAETSSILLKDEILKPSYPELSEIGQSLLQPTNFFTENNSRLHDKVNKLPPVPSTAYLVLLGFSCVLMVKHPKAWIVAFSGVIFIGKTCAVYPPKLFDWGMGQIAGNKQSIKNSVADATRIDLSSLVFDEGETREFAGLLRRLAGYSDGDSSFIINGGGWKKWGGGADSFSNVFSFGSNRGTISSPSAIESSPYSLNPFTFRFRGLISTYKILSSLPNFLILPRGPPR